MEDDCFIEGGGGGTYKAINSMQELVHSKIT